HIHKEKIEFATILTPTKKKVSDKLNHIIIQEEIIKETLKDKDNEFIEEDDGKQREVKIVSGIIKKETNKALLIQFDNNVEIWVPKSRIYSGFENNKEIPQDFSIDSWILSKNKIIS
ncbi:MAG: hypothetical protein ACFFAO_17165, partial [Candidatus Hermodarchaeota archaeon]